jgi:hypothetical protein
MEDYHESPLRVLRITYRITAAQQSLRVISRLERCQHVDQYVVKGRQCIMCITSIRSVPLLPRCLACIYA